MDFTRSIYAETLARARRRADALGLSVDQVVRTYLAGFLGDDSTEFERLSRASQGNSGGWKFNREELHERR